MLVDAREGVEDCEGLEIGGFWLAVSGKMGLFVGVFQFAYDILILDIPCF